MLKVGLANIIGPKCLLGRKLNGHSRTDDKMYRILFRSLGYAKERLERRKLDDDIT